jgi:hypothetical protein
VAIATVPDTVSGSGSKIYFPLSAVPSGFNGSVVVSSDKPLAAVVDVLKSDVSGGASYGGFSSGATTVNLPLIMKSNAGFMHTWFNVQNTGTSVADVHINYQGGCTEAATIQPNSSQTFDQKTSSCLPSGHVGTATITSTQPVAAVVMRIADGTSSLLAYNGVASANTKPVMPLVISNYYNFGTGIWIQNTGASATNVTLSYTPSAGFPGAACTETHTIAANSSAAFSVPQLPLACGTAGEGVNGGFLGSAAVTTNSASMPLAAIVELTARGTAAAAAYNAVNSSNATNKVSLPLAMDRLGVFFTAFTVANVGISTTNVACTFSGAGAPPNVATTHVAAGASLIVVQLNAGTAGYVGSVACTATGGDQKIAAIAIEASTAATVTQDLLLVYEGFNY